VKTKVFLTFGFFFLTSTFLFPQQRLSINEAIKIALEKNYDINLAKSDAEISSNNFSLGNAGILPRVDVTGSQTKTVTNTKQEYADGSSVDKGDASSNSTNAGIALSWTLFDGFKMFTSYAKLREYKELGEINLRNQIENSISSVIQTYYNVVVQKYLYRVAKESITISEERVKLAEEKLSVGSASQLDVLRAKVDLNADKSNLLAQEVTLSSLKVILNRLLSREVSDDFDVDDTIDIKGGLSFDQLKAAAIKNNADVLQSEKNKILSSYDVGLTKSDYYPKISLTGGYTYFKSQSDANLVKSSRSYGYNYGLNLSWNLFIGFTTRLQYENALIALDKNDIKLRQSISVLESNMLIAYKNYEKNLEILKLEEENVSVAKENLDLALEQLKIGLLSPIEFRDVQKNYTTAQSRLSSARYTAKMSEKDLLKLSGILLPR
jgi:outer membrane protein TolC